MFAMPLIPSTYRAPWWLRNGHRQTVLGAFRPAPAITYQRERIETPDGDFLDVDWLAAGSPRPLALLSFGMEGHAQRPYVRGMVAAFRAAGWDALVWHYRSTSGEPNRKLHFYHSGMVEDLEAVLACARAHHYTRIALIGFSLGGNMVLNYLGRRGPAAAPEVAAAAVFSVPCEVMDCARRLREPQNALYTRRFLESFREKIRGKMPHWPGRISDERYEDIRTLEDYDARYTAPHFGFPDVPTFYRAVSSRYVLDHIARPTLMVNALDDPFMGPLCFPTEAAQGNPHLFLETPAHGGHLGFLRGPLHRWNWCEERAVHFAVAHLPAPA